ncbi:MAG: hypothetical protein WCK47_06155 [bacterium]
MASKQKQIQRKLTSIENRLSVCSEYTKLWSEYFKSYSEGFEDRKIQTRDEDAFFEVMNVLALNHFRFIELAGEYFKEGSDILRLLADTVSLQVIKQMSDAQYSKLLIDWHTLFILMNKAIGKFKAQVPAPPVKK